MEALEEKLKHVHPEIMVVLLDLQVQAMRRVKLELRRRFFGHVVHSTDNLAEADRDAMLLFGRTVSELGDANPQAWNGQVQYLERELTGADGWPSLSEFFRALNALVPYVVIRNFEQLPNEPLLDGHEDLDLLVADRSAIALAAAESLFPDQPHRVHAAVRIGEQRVRCDFRFIGDDYYDECWQKHILGRRVHERGFYRPDVENYFFSLLYHALVHKRRFADDYRERLETLSHELGICVSEPSLLLARWLAQQGYAYTRPRDRSVYFSHPTGIPLVNRRNLIVIDKAADRVTKIVHTDCDYGVLHREAHWLRQFSAVSFVPRLLDVADDRLVMSYVGERLTRENLPNDWRHQAEEILVGLKRQQCCHNDIRPANLCVRNSRIHLIDFGWATGPGEQLRHPPCLGGAYKSASGFDDAFSLRTSLEDIYARTQR